MAATVPIVMPTPTSGDTGRCLVKLTLQDNPENNLVHWQTHSDGLDPSSLVTLVTSRPRGTPKLAPPHASFESQSEQPAGRPTLQTCSSLGQWQA
eukprot:scaffold16156_cov68-Phaeocystis_antarctica.AAC.1